eukprot:gene69-75_t
MSINYRVKQRLQAALKQQSHGLLSLTRLFKSFDTDHSGALSWEEFCAALQKCGLAPSPQDIRSIFLDLDKDGNNEISYTEFIQVMRGELSNQRKALIKHIFESIDTDRDGQISMTDIGKCFNPKNHPDVRAGRITAATLLKEFFDLLSIFTDTGYLNLSQFMEYYASSAAFDDDIKFAEVMKGLWTTAGTSSSTPSLQRPTTTTSSAYFQSTVGGLLTDVDPGLNNNLERLREQLKARGARGFVGLQRKFRIMDDDGSRTLNLVEFKKALRESGVTFTELQMSQLFTAFDRDRNGAVDFDEFLVTARGPMNARRRKLIHLAFGATRNQSESLTDKMAKLKVSSVDDLDENSLRIAKLGPSSGAAGHGTEIILANLGTVQKRSSSVPSMGLIHIIQKVKYQLRAFGATSFIGLQRKFRIMDDDGNNRLDLNEFKKAMKELAGDSSETIPHVARLQDVLNRKSGGVSSQNSMPPPPPPSVNIRSSYDNSFAPVPPRVNQIEALSPSKLPAAVAYLVGKLKEEMRARGAHGFVGMQRKFRIIDDDNSKSLSYPEFKKAMKELNMQLSDSEMRTLKGITGAKRRSALNHFRGTIPAGVLPGTGLPQRSQPSSAVKSRKEEILLRKMPADIRLLVDQFKTQIRAKGGLGFISLQRKFRIMDDDNSKTISMTEFKKAMKELNISLSEADQRSLFEYFDTDNRQLSKSYRANPSTSPYIPVDRRNQQLESGGLKSMNKKPRQPAPPATYGVKVLLDKLKAELKARGANGFIGLQRKFKIMDDNNDRQINLPEFKKLKAQGSNASSIALFGGGEYGYESARRPQTAPESCISGSRKKGVEEARSSVYRSSIVLGDDVSSNPHRKKPATYKTGVSLSNVASGNIRQKPLDEILSSLRSELARRGARGIVGLQRKFRIIDDNGDGSLSLGEFTKAMIECDLRLSEEEILQLFRHFDMNGDGNLDFEEFLVGVRRNVGFAGSSSASPTANRIFGQGGDDSARPSRKTFLVSTQISIG